jgi:hypothetical protein
MRELSVPCSYQGGKQRVAAQVVDQIFGRVNPDARTVFYDLCCGSGAVAVELLNRGVSPERIVMLDASSWGCFWGALGRREFDLGVLDSYLARVPEDKSEIHAFAASLSREDATIDECYKYVVLQACAFGGKQVWREGKTWRNAFFRQYWVPTETSVRRSPANPMQPSPGELRARIAGLVDAAAGVRCIHADIRSLLDEAVPANAVVYIDPPYGNSTGYGFEFGLDDFVAGLQGRGVLNIFVSECVPVSADAVRLVSSGPNGGISGNRARRHEEWLSVFGGAYGIVWPSVSGVESVAAWA